MSAFLLAVWLRSLVLAALGLVAVGLLRKRSASVRHAVAVSTLVAILALPILGALIRPHKVVELPAETSMIVVPMTASPSLAARPTTVVQDETPASDLPAKAALALWLLGVTAGVVRMGVGLVTLRKRIGNAEPTPVPAMVPVLEDREATVPMTAWWGRHRIFLPGDWHVWSSGQLDSALRHEQAHIRRGDWFTRLGGQLIGVLFWPNPLALLLHRQAKKLAEQAADDLVISSGVAPWRYAQDLLQIARRAQAAAPMAAIPLADKADVARRIEMVLEQNRPRRAVSPTGVIAIGFAVLALTIPMASWAAQPAQQGEVVAVKGEPTKVVQGGAIQSVPTTQRGTLTVAGAPLQPYTISARIYRSSEKLVLPTNTDAASSKGDKGFAFVVDPQQNNPSLEYSLKSHLDFEEVHVITVPEGKKTVLSQLNEKDLASAPTIRTLEGMPASITQQLSGDAEYKDTLSVEPKALKNGKIALKVGFEQAGKDGKISMPPVIVNLKNGDKVVLVKQPSAKQPHSGIVIVIQARKYSPDGP